MLCFASVNKYIYMTVVNICVWVRVRKVMKHLGCNFKFLTGLFAGQV